MPAFTPDVVARIRSAILRFWEDRRRDLPWRRTEDPYRVWVSEVMLQQTRVEAAIPYYMRWMERFPTLDALAAADQEEVLRLWAGLGYYSRARNLHRAARLVRERHGGVIPEDAGALRDLPGVGPYTAGAVASIAFGAPEPVVDGNIRRVLSRLLDLARPGNRELWAAARELVDPDRPGPFNQAFMELGSTVCTPRGPRCGECPIAGVCAARAAGTQEERPLPKEARPVPEVTYGVAVVRGELGAGSDGAGPGANGPGMGAVFAGPHFRVVRRPEQGLLGGMWEFPGREVEEGEDPREVAVEVAHGVMSALAVEGAAAIAADPAERAKEDRATLVEGLRPLLPIEHRFSHLVVTYRPFLFEIEAELGGQDAGEDARWVRLDAMDDLPLPAAQRKIVEALRDLV